MKESLFIPIMIASPVNSPCFFYEIVSSIPSFKTPKGVEIKGVHDASDLITEHIAHLVRKKNYIDERDNPNIVDEKYSLMQIDLEVDQSIRYQQLPWLEEQIKDFIRGYDYSVVLYCFYLINDGKAFHSLNMAKVIMDEGFKIVDDPIEDDLSPLLEMTEFLNFLWYRHPEESILDAYPDIAAKLFLLFG